MKRAGEETSKPSKQAKTDHNSDQEASDHSDVNHSDDQSDDSPEVPKPLTNAEGERYFELSTLKRVTVRKWKSNTLVDIREFYEDSKSGELKPGKKGISLTVEQFRSLRSLMDSVDAMLPEE